LFEDFLKETLFGGQTCTHSQTYPRAISRSAIACLFSGYYVCGITT
jgi:hypothetical protein